MKDTVDTNALQGQEWRSGGEREQQCGAASGEMSRWHFSVVFSHFNSPLPSLPVFLIYCQCRVIKALTLHFKRPSTPHVLLCFYRCCSRFCRYCERWEDAQLLSHAAALSVSSLAVKPE